MSNQFDFIVVGAGAAGCLLASRLSRTSTAPSVLLVEAGDVLDDPGLRDTGRKFVNLADPSLGWTGYSHVQKNVNGRSVAYPRGKGLGGSTMINAMVYYIGSSEEYDFWADVTGLPKWRWPETKERFRRIERFHDDTPADFRKYAHTLPENHGSTGPVDVSLPSVWESGVWTVFKIAQAHGYPINPDQNSGNPIGIGLSPSTVSHGLRTTAASAFLENRPPNLMVWTNAFVTRILFAGRTAVGVGLADGRSARGTKATILCAGALDTPKLLLLSGVGPKADLVPLGIEVVHDLEGVGKNLQDHIQSFIETRLSIKLLDRDVVRHGEPDKAGPWSCLPFCFLKVDEILETEEFKLLDPSMQNFLKGKTVPQLSLGMAAPLFSRGRTFPEGVSYYHVYVNCLMNPQSRGELRLRSTNPADPPHFDFNALSHPYDLRSYINNTRKVMEFIEGDSNSAYFEGYINGPASKTDQDIETWLRAVSGPQYHATGTVMMGKPETNKLACVGPDFQIFGVKNLYVADLSVCPTTPCCMTQSTAYMIAETAAETFIEKFGLEQ
ncbi:uncharacterized protein A1O5_03749 [Cladophialophora psammophila CBS 110553]|uniref:Glucose-methanol-choline oxidoreductase N-terminal domain-containing protein n=1 Tax=Cladophialophora psammophila CBS 110553 TaxID=1182543 RepID=W9WXB7_9EURO|nr:uncharacterized protein A1O5_03749 [Cladophialophora psammophila CBS 110553]EXJ72603.1 hypothetical protein A1O5_03749 [Cladophialophora psammophila CBS 110553]